MTDYPSFRAAGYANFVELNHSPPPLADQVMLFANDFSNGGKRLALSPEHGKRDWSDKEMPDQ